jgi:cysteine desulfurase
MKRFCYLKHFFRLKRNVYLDNNATTNVSRSVRRNMNHVLKVNYGNPSSLYSIAAKSSEILETARNRVAEAINAQPLEIHFTGCASESNNAVLKSLSNHFYPQKKKIIATQIEHLSVINTLEFLKHRGIIIEYCPVDKNGSIRHTELVKLIDENTFLICCMLANNEIGTIQDIKAVTDIAKQQDILVFSDCVQAFGKIPVDVHDLGVDYASFSAHKLYGPKGAGALYVKQGRPFEPYIHGGHQENGMRAGTESVHNIAGFGTACRNVKGLLSNMEKVRDLKSKLIAGLKEIRPDCIINSPEKDCLPNTVSITLPGVNISRLMAMLDYNGIAVSAGSACSSAEEKPSHVLKAIGLTDSAARETIRISLGCSTTEKDIRYTVKVFKNFFNGNDRHVNLIMPSQLNEALIFDEQTYILDVRPNFLRKKLKGIPNSHEISFVSIRKYLRTIPKDKHIIVVCQHGNLSYVAAYKLLMNGFSQVSSLQHGIVGWKARWGELYKKYAFDRD